ncbi:MAG: HEAT repeat domain-containing protein [Nitrospirae bacterium]|nr:HEAT repeat domain-containing protein [Nitrospirota bacterium]
MNKYTPECPFCGKNITAPEKTKTDLGEIISGRCVCGAVYVCDPTGHNMGEAYMDALAFAKGDWKLDEMNSGEDYLTQDMDYDLRTHSRLYSKSAGQSGGKLIFVKIRKGGEKDEPSENSRKAAPDASAATREHITKKKLKSLLEEKLYGEIANEALADKGVIRKLISSSYDKDDVLSWRAIEALGVVSGALTGKGKTEIVRDTVRRLLWSMGEESGGIGWSAAEMIGEIIRNNPDEFADIAPILWSFREEDMFRPGILWAVGRIAEIKPDLVLFIIKDMPKMFADKNPAVRGYAAWVAGILGDEYLVESFKGLSDDDSEIDFYYCGELLKKRVMDIVDEIRDKRVNKHGR